MEKGFKQSGAIYGVLSPYVELSPFLSLLFSALQVYHCFFFLTKDQLSPTVDI